MSVFTKALFSLLVFTVVTANAQIIGTEDPSEIEATIETLNEDIAELHLLTEKIKTAQKMDRDVLVFRQDERSFRLLGDFETLVKQVADLPDEAPKKKELKAGLIELSDGVSDAIFNRIAEIKQRIDHSYSELESLSGTAQVTSLAFLQGLEATRIGYYQAMANHIKGRDALGLSSDELLGRLDARINLYAETLAGRIEMTAAAQTQIKRRAELVPGNADIESALMDLAAQHQINLARLEAMILVLDDLGLSSSSYKTTLLQHSGSDISVSLFSSKALLTVLRDSWVAVKSKISANAPDMLFRLLIFLAVLFVFRIFSRVTKRVVRAASDRSSLDLSDLLKNMLVSISGGAVMATGILMALSQIGISLAPMLAGLGVAGFIIGFALQDSLGNFAAGAMILIYRPYDVDDFVEVTGASGLVKKMNLVSTTIVTFDNQTLVVPNSKIWGDVIKNVTAQKVRRVDLVFGIGYGDDIEQAERVLHEIVLANEKVLKQPEPNIRLHTLADSSVNFVVRPWTKTDDYWDVYWEITREVKVRFDREGISIPFPQSDVHLYTEKES
ncbi:MAG: mechanosensitive ion channel family protein [Xanthomonadales bacterium]|nr:mechanosensitive ion channel family protein [Xanthomonadales bacterium]